MRYFPVYLQGYEILVTPYTGLIYRNKGIEKHVLSFLIFTSDGPTYGILVNIGLLSNNGLCKPN